MSGVREPAIRCDGVALAYGERRVLHDLDLVVQAGGRTAIIGPSGSGKTSLLNVLAGLVEPDAGLVVVEGLEVSGASHRQRAKHRQREVAMVFQFGELLPELTVGENIELPLWIRGERPSSGLAEGVLDAVGLSGYADAWPAQLSGGETQRVAVARAVATRPSVILCDEPTGALDATASAQVIELLCRVADQTDATLVVATHDRAVAEEMDTVLILQDAQLARVA